MKNIQIIDGANNCTYDIFGINDEDFKIIFPNGQDIEFIEDLKKRENKKLLSKIFNKLWNNPINKKKVNGINGTLFYEMPHKKKYYPTKKESEMIMVL